MKLFSLSFVLIASLLSTCRDESNDSDILKIEFGTSFGMCAGFCTQVLTVTDGLISKVVTPRLKEDLSQRTCSADFDIYDQLVEKINLNGFQALSETIGCPDCADGGAEWIEITTAGGSKKVTYEFGKEPKEVKSFISELRKHYDQLGECE